MGKMRLAGHRVDPPGTATLVSWAVAACLLTTSSVAMAEKRPADLRPLTFKAHKTDPAVFDRFDALFVQLPPDEREICGVDEGSTGGCSYAEFDLNNDGVQDLLLLVDYGGMTAVEQAVYAFLGGTKYHLLMPITANLIRGEEPTIGVTARQVNGFARICFTDIPHPNTYRCLAWSGKRWRR